MNLSNLSDEVLLINTKKAVEEERESLTKVLHHLREIELRTLFSALKCGSLFEYAMKHLGYSEDEAARRISAMRLLKTLPQIEEKVRSGTISLTNLNTAQTLFRREAKIAKEEATGKSGFSQKQKIEILERLENKSAKEGARIVLAYSSSPPPLIAEKIRPIAKDVIEIKFAVTEEVHEKIVKLKGLLAHSDPNISLADLFNKLLDLGIQTCDPSKKIVKPRRSLKKAVPIPPRENSPAAKQVLSDTKRENRETHLFVRKKSVRIPNEIKRAVWKRDQSQCQNCKSTFALQIDHRQPRALGGTNELSNLRLLCRACNRRAAIEAFGVRQMSFYL